MLAIDLRSAAKSIQEAKLAAETSTLASLFQRQSVEYAASGQIVFFQGDPAKHVFTVLRGTLRICRMLPDGRRVISGFLRTGDIVGISFKRHYVYSAEAIGEVVFRRMPRRDFDEELALSSHLHTEMVAHLRDELAAAQNQMVLLSCKTAEQRLCSFLLQELKASRKEAAGNLIQLPMSRLDIADYLGLTIETVSRTITKLSLKKIIACRGRHGMSVLQEPALKAHAGDGDEIDEIGFSTSSAKCRH
ncbi:Crp/Fnr family transcriptional regulator [Oryzifoliimicrobium ureilyticus]|uniref:Crp/Fnr family transcriptional regulator n=1 Tax=Oryzifoliimicrobium ureilyticus TaxID=3113724 RepID=UPI0030761771